MKNIQVSNLLRVIIGLLLSVLGGLAFVLAFPPYEIWPLALVGFIPVIIAQYRVLPAKLSSLATAVAIAVWLQGYLGPVFAPIGTFMVWLPLIAGGISLLTDSGQRKFHAKTHYKYFVVSGIVSWAGSEMIRLFIPIAGTWAFIAYPFYKQIWFIQPVSIFGIIGMGMLVMLVNYVLGLIVLNWLDKRWQLAEDIVVLDPKLVRKWTISGAVIVGAWAALSLVLFALPINTPTRTVAAIQPSLSPIVSANQDQASIVEQLHQRMIEQTESAAMQGAEFIVWPEGAFLWDPQGDDKLDLTGLAQETNSYLAAGYVVIMDEGFRNEATVINPQGDFLGVFGKDHPVVFGGETSLTRGTYPVYETEIGVLGTIICYDLDYTDTARKLARQGVQLVGVPSNDWGSIAEKHYTHVVFRAVENQIAMVKADGGFDSAIIDPRGKIHALAAYPQGGEATLVADVQIGTGKGTVTTTLGDWMGWLALVGMAFFTFGSGWLEKSADIDNHT